MRLAISSKPQEVRVPRTVSKADHVDTMDRFWRECDNSLGPHAAINKPPTSGRASEAGTKTEHWKGCRSLPVSPAEAIACSMTPSSAMLLPVETESCRSLVAIHVPLAMFSQAGGHTLGEVSWTVNASGAQLCIIDAAQRKSAGSAVYSTSNDTSRSGQPSSVWSFRKPDGDSVMVQRRLLFKKSTHSVRWM